MAIISNGSVVKNVTLNMIYKLFTDIASANFLIKTFTIGDIFEVDLTKVEYTLAHLITKDAKYSERALTYNFQLIIMDLVKKDESSEEDVLSDTLQIVGDFVSELRNGSEILSREYTENEYRFSTDVSCTPFTERFDSEVSGWAADISITVDFDASACVNDVPQ